MGSWVTGLVILLVLISAGLSVLSHLRPGETGLVAGRLRDCPRSPNCLSSEDRKSPSFAKPVILTVSPETAWERAEEVVREMGGTVVTKDKVYLHAVFVSPLFRYVDDFELRLDKDKGRIHFRSASRVGYSDLGANRRRVEAFRFKMNAGVT